MRDGVGGLVAPQAYRAMGVDVETLFCEPDGRFPNHHPDPTILKTLFSLKGLWMKRMQISASPLTVTQTGSV
jgi:phosphomannomutase